MTPKLVIPYGTTEPLDLQLTDDGEAIDGSGLTLGLEIFHYTGGTMVDLGSGESPTVAWLSQSDGTVRVTNADVLAVGSYYARFTLDNGVDSLGYVPNGKSADQWKVVPVANR